MFEEAHRARRGPGLRVAGGSEAHCRDQTVPRWRQEFAEQKDNGRSDPAPRRWTSYHSRGEAVQQDTGISIQASSGRFDMQFGVKGLSEMMSKPRKLGDLRLARLARYLVGTQKVSLRFDHGQHGDIVRILMDSDWAGSEERYSTHGALEFHGGHLVDSWAAADQVRALSTGEAELHKIVSHEGSSRSRSTRRNHQHRGRDGFHRSNRDVFPNVRRKDEAPTHKGLLQKLPLEPIQ